MPIIFCTISAKYCGLHSLIVEALKPRNCLVSSSGLKPRLPRQIGPWRGVLPTQLHCSASVDSSFPLAIESFPALGPEDGSGRKQENVSMTCGRITLLEHGSSNVLRNEKANAYTIEILQFDESSTAHITVECCPSFKSSRPVPRMC